MKILDRPPWSHEFTCKGCKSKILAELGDLVYYEYTDMGGDTETGYCFTCPVCDDDFYVKPDKIFVPRDELNAARARFQKKKEERYAKNRK